MPLWATRAALLACVALLCSVAAERAHSEHPRLLGQERGVGTDVRAQRTQDSSVPQENNDKRIVPNFVNTPPALPSSQADSVDQDPGSGALPARRASPRLLGEERAVPMDKQYPQPLVVGPSGPHTASMIIIHGLGETAAGSPTLMAQMLSKQLPYVKFILPNAQTQPVTVFKGALRTSWYDIASFQGIADKQDTNGLLASSQYIETLVKAEVAGGIDSQRIMVAGFSQGGVLALLSLREDIKLAGVLSMSGYLTLADRPPIVSGSNARTPVLICTGADDQYVRLQDGQTAYAQLQAAGANVQFRSYEGVVHAMGPQEVLDATAFMKICLPPDVQTQTN